MNIPFLDLQRQYRQIKKEVDLAIQRVVKRQFFVLGEELEQFEYQFAKYLDVRYVVGVNSGTDGLVLALRALGIGKGDEVITSSHSFIATALAISLVGAVPVFTDIDSDTYQIDIHQVEEKITKKTKAILPVSIYGAPCKIDSLLQISKQYKIPVVEDACQAHGSSYKKKKIGTFGVMGVFSFYPTKNLGCYGDGGGICTNDESLYRKLVKLRNYGQSEKYCHDSFGINSRLDEIQAAILHVKLKHLDRWNKERNQLANYYKKQLATFEKQKIIKNGVSNYHLFVIQHTERDKLKHYLHKNGIATRIHYPIPIHLQKAYEYLGYKKGDFPNAEKLAKYCLSLPLFPQLSKQQVSYLLEKISDFR